MTITKTSLKDNRADRRFRRPANEAVLTKQQFLENTNTDEEETDTETELGNDNGIEP